jgi:hypothetical protein
MTGLAAASNWRTGAKIAAIANMHYYRAGSQTGGVIARGCYKAKAHDPEKHVLDLIGDGNRFSDKIMRN